MERNDSENWLFDGFEKGGLWDIRVPKGASQSEPIHFIVQWKDNAPSIRMFHFDVTSLTVNFQKTETLQRAINLPP